MSLSAIIMKKKLMKKNCNDLIFSLKLELFIIFTAYFLLIYQKWVLLSLSLTKTTATSLTLLRMGFFGTAHRWWRGGFLFPLPKIRHTYPTMMKLRTVIPYLRKIQKMNKSRDISLEYCWHQHFFTGNQQVLLHQEIQI